MSGGSLAYVYQRVEDAANSVSGRASKPEHHALASHLRKVARALHDLEWVWSNDWGDGDELQAIRAIIGREDILEAASQRAKVALADLTAALDAEKSFD